MISRILKTEPNDRLTLVEILNHEFLKDPLRVTENNINQDNTKLKLRKKSTKKKCLIAPKIMQNIPERNLLENFNSFATKQINTKDKTDNNMQSFKTQKMNNCQKIKDY